MLLVDIKKGFLLRSGTDDWIIRCDYWRIAANGSQSQSVGAICGIVCVPCWFYWSSFSIWIQILFQQDSAQDDTRTLNAVSDTMYLMYKLTQMYLMLKVIYTHLILL